MPAMPGVKPSRDGARQKPEFSEDGLGGPWEEVSGQALCNTSTLSSAITLLGTVLEVIFLPDGYSEQFPRKKTFFRHDVAYRGEPTKLGFNSDSQQ